MLALLCMEVACIFRRVGKCNVNNCEVFICGNKFYVVSTV